MLIESTVVFMVTCWHCDFYISTTLQSKNSYLYTKNSGWTNEHSFGLRMKLDCSCMLKSTSSAVHHYCVVHLLVPSIFLHPCQPEQPLWALDLITFGVRKLPRQSYTQSDEAQMFCSKTDVAAVQHSGFNSCCHSCVSYLLFN